MEEKIKDNLFVNDEINFLELFLILWDHKKLIIFVTSIFGIVSIFIALSIPNQYTSQVLLSPTFETSQTSRLLDQYGSFASMAGINLPKGQATKKDIAIEVLNSRNFITNFIKDRDILVPLMASKDWNHETNELEIDNEIYDVKSKKWVRDTSYPFSPKPSYQEAYEHWHRDIFSLSNDKEKGFVRLSITHFSPFIANDWATWIVEDLNNYMRENDIEQSTKSLEYLYRELERVNYDELNTLLYNLIEEDIKILSIANTKSEYIFKIIDPAIVPQEKSAPSRALICIVITFLGGMMICLFVLFREYILPRQNNSPKQ